VSDTLGAALWGAELMFEIAAASGVGVNFHAGPDKVYTPIAGATRPHRAHPLYYGMLLFAQAARGTLVPVRQHAAAKLASFAARAEDGALRVCLINKSMADTRARIDPGRPFAAAAAMRLTGPEIEATAGLKLGGAAVDVSGGWAPGAWEMLEFDSARVLVDVPAASAVLVRMQPR